jgi:HK97 family phage major capsid protein
MDISELKHLLEQQGEAWNEFKRLNDERLKTVEGKVGGVDALVETKLGTINTALDSLSKSIVDMGLKVNRLSITGGGSKPEETEEMKDYKKAFNLYLRKGRTENLIELGEKAMSVGSDPDGGYWVTPDVGGRMIQKIFESSPIRQIASVQTIGTDALEGTNDLEEGSCGWVAEQGARPATGTAKTAKWRIPVHEMYSMPEATQTLLDDANVNVEMWLADKNSSKMARVEATAFVSGNGVGKPRGFLDYTTVATDDATRAWGQLQHVVTGTSGGFGSDPNGSDKLIDLVHKLKSAYRTSSRFLMSRATVGAVRKLKDTNGSYVWLPSMQAAQPSLLLGYPVTEAEDMPAIAANSLSIAFGNFSEGYQIVDRQGIRTLRDPFTNKPFVRFYSTRRVGGDVLNFEAIKFLKFST